MQTDNKIALSIIIVNYKAVDLIINCIQSIIKETKEVVYEIIVIDNHSSDNCKETLNHQFPAVRVIELNTNEGFARANNVGILKACGDTYLLLNPDTIILNQAIDKCYHQFSQLKGHSACGVQLLNEDKSLQISGSYNMRGGINFLLALPYWGNILKTLGYTLKTKVPHVLLDSEKAIDVDWINGAFIMTTRDAVEKAGMLDEEFFLYSEEIEWCARLRSNGRLCIFGNCQVLHLQGETTKTAFSSEGKGYYNLSDKKGLQLIVSGFLRIRKQFGAAWTLFAWVNFLWAIPFSFFCFVLNKIRGHKQANINFRHLKGFYKNVVRFTTDYLWRILLRKPYFYKVL